MRVVDLGRQHVQCRAAPTRTADTRPARGPHPRSPTRTAPRRPTPVRSSPSPGAAWWRTRPRQARRPLDTAPDPWPRTPADTTRGRSTRGHAARHRPEKPRPGSPPYVLRYLSTDVAPQLSGRRVRQLTTGNRTLEESLKAVRSNLRFQDRASPTSKHSSQTRHFHLDLRDSARFPHKDVVNVHPFGCRKHELPRSHIDDIAAAGMMGPCGNVLRSGSAVSWS